MVRNAASLAQIPTLDELSALESASPLPCITMYLPWLETNGATNPGRIKLKNMLREAENLLLSQGVHPEVAQEALQPARELAGQDDEFWPPRHTSLALFMRPGFFRFYHLPVKLPSVSVRVNDRFDVDPIKQLVSANSSYVLLVLDHHATQVYAGDLFALAAVPLPGFPADMAETLRIDKYPSSRELHGIAPAYVGKGSEGYHSQYNTNNVDKQLLVAFFRVIDRRLHRFLLSQHKTLILAGVTYLQALYRSVNTYRDIYPLGLRGNYRRTGAAQLKKQVALLLGSEVGIAS